MSKKFMPKVALHFEVPYEEQNKDSFKACLGVLAQQAIDYGKALELNANALIPDVVVILTPEDYLKRADTPVNVELAQLMAQKAPPKTSKKKVEVTREEEDNDPPVVKAMSVDQYKTEKAKAIIAEEAAQEKSVVTAKSTPAPTVDLVKQVTDKIFENLKRTEKSVTIVTAFAKAGKELTLDELMKATKLNKNDICSWLNQTGKNVKAIEKTGRGLYKFNPDKA
jgi:hypothetical protein